MKKGVLIVEDMDSDFEMVHRGFRRLQTSPTIVRTSNIQDTAALIEATQPEELPHLIVLDLRLSDGDGRELLSKFKSHPEWQRVPVLVWSGWTEPSLGETCRQHGAEAYYAKAADATISRQTVERIASHWQSITSLS